MVLCQSLLGCQGRGFEASTQVAGFALETWTQVLGAGLYAKENADTVEIFSQEPQESHRGTHVRDIKHA